jgi:hypothetical protein
MSPLWRFLHFFTMVMWIGGGLAVLVAGVAMRRLDRSFWGGIAEVQGALYRTLVGPGAMLNTLSGLMLTFKMYGALSTRVGAGLGSMQALGVLAALVTLLGAMPAATRLSRLEPTGDTSGAFDRLSSRLTRTGALGTALAIGALVAGSLYRG